MKKPQNLASVRSRFQKGFTLLELVVVVAILVILAGFILPKFDVFKLKANKGVAAANMTAISRSIQQYYVQSSVYPDGWDSLLTPTDALWTPGDPGQAAGLDPQLVGGPPAASPQKLTVSTALTEKEARSLSRIGVATLYDVDTASTALPNERFTIARPIDTGVKVAVINEADDDGQGIINHIYPGAGGVTPSGVKLVAVGLGSRNTMLGQTVQEIPFYSNTDQTQYYSRYLAVFAVKSSGSRAELKAIVGSDADRIDEEIADYFER